MAASLTSFPSRGIVIAGRVTTLGMTMPASVTLFPSRGIIVAGRVTTLRDVPGEILDLGLADRTMMAPSVPFSLLGHRFGARAGWSGVVEERCYIYCKADGGSRRHGAAGSRRWPRGDERAQGGGPVWHRGDIDGRPDKDNALVPVLKMKIG